MGVPSTSENLHYLDFLRLKYEILGVSKSQDVGHIFMRKNDPGKHQIQKIWCPYVIEKSFSNQYSCCT